MDIAIESETDDAGRTVLAVTGAIDLQTREQLLQAGRDALAASSSDALVLDLDAVTFIDSTGIGALIELGHDATDEDGGGLVIRNPSHRVLRILEMTGLADAWAMETSD
jgi:anti-sigma B factor antagonist